VQAYGERNVPRTDSWDAGLDRAGHQTDPRGIPGTEDFDPIWAVSASKIALDESGDFLLEQLSRLGELLAVRNKDVKMLKAGVYAPIHTRFGYAATTRTTSSAPNLQNFRKKRGIRECLMPREGCCFIETDYPSLELFTLAQVCAWKLQRYDLVQNMNAGRDYHAVIGGNILKMPYEEVMRLKGTDERVKNARDCGKYGNYGLCGYMTDPATFALYVNLGSRTEENPHGVRWTTEQAAEVMDLWRQNATDPVAFLKYVDTLKNAVGLYDVQIPGTGIVRRGCTRTAAANTHFQGLGATVARRAGWRIARRQYMTGDMPSRTVLFVHDAFVAECRIEDRDGVARIQEEEMAAALTEICPDMHIWCESHGKPPRPMSVIDSAAQDHYSKFAKSKRDEKGSLIVCRV
jgi:DNA polymerase I-like protein with 3'-5' exonuclease and polymerase domains